MRYPNIALSGKAGSGKDTVAAYLVEEHGFTRLALADPLKEMAEIIDPIVSHVAGEPVRLTRLLELHGWDRAKTVFPEVRRLLQQVGQTVRHRDPDFWLRALYGAAERVAGPIVVTDVRYPNELASLQRAGFTAVRITRPEIQPVRDHDSETALDGVTFVDRILNDGDLATLYQRIDALLETIGR